jgi:hypothetical protein
MLFAKLKTGALSLRLYSNINNNYITSQKLSWLYDLLLYNKFININKSILICLYTLCEFLCRLLYNYGTESL